MQQDKKLTLLQVRAWIPFGRYDQLNGFYFAVCSLASTCLLHKTKFDCTQQHLHQLPSRHDTFASTLSSTDPHLHHASPPNQRTHPNRDAPMPRNTPRHGIQILWTKHGPDKQMRAQRRTRRHDANKHNARPQRQQRNVASPDGPAQPVLGGLLLVAREVRQERVLARHPIARVELGCGDVAGCAAVGAEQEEACQREVDGAGPVGEEDEGAYRDDVVAAYAVVGVGEVDGGYGVCVAQGEEGGLREEERR
jgi:hypothetical protein